MKKRFLLLMLFVALLAPWAVKGQNTHLVCDGTQTNSAVPIRNGSGSQTEFVYPASMLTAMDGGTITSVKFFYSTTTASYSSTATVYVEEVSTTTVSSSAWCYNQNSATRVYQGTTLTLADSEMTITFSTPYVYNGGNLCFNIWYSGSAPSVTSYGVSTDDYTSGYDWAITPPVSRPFSRAKYLPKAEFTYTPSTSTCKKPTMLTPTDVTASTATLRWTEKGSANSWILQYGTDSEFGAGTYTEVTSDFNTEAAPTITKAVTALNDFTKYYVRVKSVCTPGTDESDWSNTINFTTKQNPVVVGDSWSDNFEGTKCGWQLINGSLTNSNWAWGTAVNNGGTHAIYVSDDNGISNHFNNSGYAKVFAAKLFTFADNKYIFSYDWKCNGESTDFLRVALVPATETLTAGTDYSTISSTTLPTGWVALDGGSSLRGKTTWQTIPEQTKQVPAGNYYVVLAWRQDYSGGSQPPAAVDNFSITRVACDYNVADLAHDPESVTGHEASISWTNGDPGSWQVAWSKDYTFAAANTQTEIVNTNTINLVNLDASSTYYVKARAYCGGEDYGSWCDADHFDTDCEVVSSFPWSETFEGRPANTNTSYSETYKFNDPCWLNEQLESTTTGSGTVTWFQVCSYEQGGNSTNKLQLPDMKKGALTELRLPEMTLPNNNYQFTLDMYRVSAAETEGIRVFASTDGEIAGATELAFISRNYSTGDGHLIPGESKSGWYTYELPIGFSGTCYIILRGESQYSNASYMDNFVVETIPTCIRPKSPTSTAQTAHTATLSWTNGEEGQDAWQIAYSTSSTFVPDDNFTPGEGEGLVDVTTNPATISGLTKGTTYYAYVRANCGGSDPSKWSKAKATFTTKSGNAVPTGLAYDNTSLTSSEVTVNWNGVATNDLHTSFELYISTESTTPVAAPEAGDNFITGIIASTHHFNTLTSETKYYVWVRDNCGADGLSAWSSSINFTTASDCQTPDGLTFSNISSSSLTVDWADHGTVSNWNVRYSSDGGTTWTTIEDATKPCPIDGLIGNTEYRVQVQATCNTEVWSAYATCRTAYSVPFTEEFSSTSIPTNWENKQGLLDNVMTGTALTSGSQWSFGTNSNLFNSHARINIYGGIAESNARYGWLITPNITVGSNYSISFDLALTNYDTPTGMTQPVAPQTTGTDDKFIVLVSTDNEATWTVLRQWDNAGSAYVYNDIAYNGETVYIDLAAYSGQTVRIAFYGESTVKNADNNLHIDNVEINITSDCHKPQNVTASNETNHSATITWVAGTVGQELWQLKYNKNDDFDPNTEGESVVVETNPTYTFNKTLDAASMYVVYVRGNCGTTTDPDYGPWSKKCTFNTGALNPAPTTFAKTEVGPDWVDLYWNAPAGDYLSGYGIYYSTESATPATTAEALVTINNTAAPTSEAPYRLPELESEETYYIWVRANHEANVYSSWKAISGSYITTLTACPTPTNLAANNILHTSADLTWTGYSDSYTLNYYKYNPVFEYDFESATPWAVDEFDPCSTYDGDGNMSGAISGITFDNQNYTGAFIAFQNGIASNAFAHSGNAFGASFYSSDGNDDWFILPEITIESGYKLQFWARSFNDNYGLETFKVGVYGNTDGTFSSFLAGETESVEAPVEWTQFRYDLSAYEGQSIKLAINHDSGDVFAFFIDDIFVGTITEEGSITNVTSPYTITVLTADTKYDVRVKGNCEGGTYSDACTFTTIDDNIKIFKTEGYWNNTANWSGGIPTIANDVIIRANATIGSTCEAEANSITYEGSPAPTLTIADGGQLKHAENVNATLQKEITAWTTKDVGGWYFIASPVDGAAIDESFDQTAIDLFKYDEQDAYWYSYLDNGQNLHPFSTLTRGVGYLHASESQQTLNFAGMMVGTNEPFSLPLSYACTYDDVKGFNLVGNPYTCNIMSGNMLIGSTPVLPIYVINDEGRTKLTAVTTDTYAIKPGEGFFVQATATNQTLTINPTAKDNFEFRYIKIVAGNENGYDNAFIQLEQGNTLRKMDIAETTSVYVMNDGDDYAAARVEELAGTMPVHFKAVEDGEFTITINAKNIEASTLILFDDFTGEEIDLLETPSYTFKAGATDPDNRFKLIFDFNNNYNGVDDNYVNGNFAYQNGDELFVSGDGTLQVFDVMGRFVMSKEIHGSESVSVSAFETGVYMLRFVGENIMTQKIVVR